MRRRSGFTLIELMIVIIIVIMAGMSVAPLSAFFRGQGARQGAAIISQAAGPFRNLNGLGRRPSTPVP
jgi:prepilin-type N-terminal cleavage/methylation domain-containing protein